MDQVLRTVLELNNQIKREIIEGLVILSTDKTSRGKNKSPLEVREEIDADETVAAKTKRLMKEQLAE